MPSRLSVLPFLLLPLALGAEPVSFRSAKPIWPQGREKEMNLTAGFRAVFDAPAGTKVELRLTASTLYRAYVNGAFRGWGPARGARGYYRVDVWDITSQLKPGRNVVAIEVAGYNVNTYWVLNQPSFLQAEVTAGDAVLASTAGAGAPFAARIATERVQKVQRYSFQRAFTEVYRMNAETDRWKRDAAVGFDAVQCATLGARQLIPRRVAYPEFALRQPLKRVSEGRMVHGAPAGKRWEDRSLAGISEKFLGYPQSELAVTLSDEMRTLSAAEKTALGGPYAWAEPIAMPAGRYQLLDFGTELSGFPGARLTVHKAAKLLFTWDEMLVDGDVDYKRLGTVNVIEWDLAPGTYDVEAFEPYSMRFLKVMLLNGEGALERVWLREYVNPDVWRAQFASSDEGLNRLFAAGRETFRQNSVDLFTDCPQRERAGWLCDSYFTARVEPALSGGSNVERSFLENYLLPKQFEFLPDGMVPMCYPADHNDGVFIPNWSLWFVLQLEEYLGRSGDRAMVDAMRPRVMKLFEYFKAFRNEDGLLEGLKSWVFIEWSKTNEFTKDVNYPSNMLYAAALASAGRMYHESALEADAARLRETIRKQSFDGEYFVDNAVRKNGKLEVTRNRTETCQYYAFYLGVATPQSHTELWKKLVTEFGPQRKQTHLHLEIWPSNAFMGNVLRLELLSREAMTAQLVKESREYLLYMAERTGTLWENIDTSASLNHGFASHVVNNLYRDVLGLYRVDAAAKTVELRFTNAGLAWCEGSIPVADGAVALRWSVSGNELSYGADVPAGYTVKVTNRSTYALKRLP